MRIDRAPYWNPGLDSLNAVISAVLRGGSAQVTGTSEVPVTSPG